jgi:multiple sugar transport system ATP-binding protein
MDEPLSNLDAKLRVQMRAELTSLHTRLKATTVYVTHDQVEAMTLGDRVAVLKDGVLQQVAHPQELYGAPVNLFVAAFIGSPPMNLVEARVDGRAVSFGDFSIPLPDNVDLSAYQGRSVILGIRPSDMEDTAVWRTESLPVVEVAAEVIEELGSEVNVLFRVNAPPVATEDTLAAAAVEGDEEALIPLIGEDDHTLFCARVDARTKARPGARVTLSLDPERFHYFDKDTGMRLGEAGAHPTVPADLALQSPESTP